MPEEYRVRVPHTETYHNLIHFTLSDDALDKRPIWSYDNKVGSALEDDIHFWLKERNINYSLLNIPLPKAEFPNCWWIIFNNKADAMLFKLSWL